ncbi:MAG: hypothetical protein ACJ72W_18915 [Actinoallomurus sp.]
MGLDVGDGSVQGVARRSVVTVGLSEQHAALKGGHEHVREMVQVRVAPEIATVLHGLEPVEVTHSIRQDRALPAAVPYPELQARLTNHGPAAH